MDALPVGKAGRFGIVRRRAGFEAGDACIVDQHIDGRMRIFEGRPVGFAGNVQRPEFAAEPGGCRGSGSFVYVGQDDARTFSNEGRAYGLADPARTTGDNAEHVVQFLHEDSFEK